MSHLVHLAGCVKNPKQHFAKIEKNDKAVIFVLGRFFVSVGNCGQTETQRKGCELKFNL